MSLSIPHIAVLDNIRAGIYLTMYLLSTVHTNTLSCPVFTLTYMEPAVTIMYGYILINIHTHVTILYSVRQNRCMYVYTSLHIYIIGRIISIFFHLIRRM